MRGTPAPVLMKAIRRTLSILLLLCLSISLTSCLGKAEETDLDKVYQADLYSFVSTHKGDDHSVCKSSLDNTEKYTLGVHIPVTGIKEADFFLSSLADTAEKEFRSAMSSASPAADGSKGVLFGDYIIEKNNQHVSVLMTFRSRFPDKDPVTEYHSVFATLDDGKVLSLGDLFGSPYLSPLADLLSEKLEADSQLTPYLGEDYYSRLSLTDASAAAFQVKGSEVTLYFNAKTILPDYSSPVVLTLEKTEIAPLLADGMYQKLFDDGAQG